MSAFISYDGEDRYGNTAAPTELSDVEIAANLTMQHHDDIVRGSEAVAGFASEHRQEVHQFVGRHGEGVQRPVDWSAPHDGNVPPSQYELQERWKRALEEEARLRTLAAEVEAKEASASTTLRRLTPNFPRKFLCLSPMVHHNIAEDIPEDRRKFMKIAYGNWWATIAMLFLNFVLSLVILMLPNKDDSVGGSSKDTSQHVGLAAAYLIGIPASFITWYWQVYKACRSRKSATYVAAFVGLVVALAFAVFMAIGIVGLGGSGAIFASHVSSTKGGGAAVPIVILCCVWIGQSFLFVYLIYYLKQFYNLDGASVDEARQQVASGAMRSYARHQI